MSPQDVPVSWTNFSAAAAMTAVNEMLAGLNVTR
jgi:hypothetical protein